MVEFFALNFEIFQKRGRILGCMENQIRSWIKEKIKSSEMEWNAYHEYFWSQKQRCQRI